MTKLTGKRRALLQALLEDEGIRLPEAHTIKRANRQEPAPLSFAQRRMWFLDQLQPGNPFYNMCESFQLKGQLSLAALEQSYNELLKRHAILRTLFVVINDEPAQVVQEYVWTPLTQIDLRSYPLQERELHLRTLATQEAEMPFSLDQGPLLRVKLLLVHQEEYILLFTMHHSIADGWSTTILVRELATHYRTWREGKLSVLAELPLQYSDYASWQQEWLQSKQFLTQLDYWKQQLSGAPAVLELPTDYLRPTIQTYQGKQILFTLPSSLLHQLKEQCRSNGVTSFMWLFSAFQVILYRHTRQEDILVGSPIAGRTHPELEDLIGYFANTLVLRTKLHGSQTFREVLKQVKEVTLDAFTHQEMPFEKLVEELHIERRLSHNPLFQVMFVLQNLPSVELTLAELEVRSTLLAEHKTTRFDLTLALEENGQELLGSVEYNADLFASTTIERLIGHFHVLLTQTLAHPEQRIVDLPLLTNGEYQQILLDWNAPQPVLPETRCLHSLFEEQVARTPDAVALISSQYTLTYQQLNAQANQLANFLHHLHIGPDIPVAVCLERSPALLVCLLAILKAGGCYVPLDAHTPPQRLIKMVDDTKAPFLLTQHSLLPSLPSVQTRILCLEQVLSSLTHFPADIPPPIEIQPDNLAYIIFTSGSTGQPKGVQIIHAAVCNLLLDMQHQLSLRSASLWGNDVVGASLHVRPETLSINEQSIIAALASFAFDMSIPELFLPLITGAQEVVFDQEAARDPQQLLPLLQQYGVTCMQATPTMWSLLLEAGLLKSHLALTTCISGAEALPWEVALQLLQTGRLLYNFYGPTETTVWSMQQRIQQEDAQVLIGRPLANTQVYILDACWQPVPIGVVGELYIGGSGLARGYLNRPDTSAERFIPHPFSSQGGARLYKTGDMARYHANGTIEYLGRSDRQMKLHGFRIEPGEIEKALRQHQAIRDAIVLAREDQPDKKQLVAYIVLKTQETIHSDQIRRFLREHLPEYMVPSVFITLTAFPLTANGKINYNTLPPTSAQSPTLQQSVVAPRDTLEAQLVHIWQETLGVVHIGITNNFFDLGGNSFSAVRLMAHIQRTYHHNFPLSLLFQEGTIEHIAQKIRQRFQQTHYSPVVPLQQGNGQRPLFCIHPGGGNVLCYRELVLHLGTEQTVYGIEDLRLFLDEGVPTFSRIEEMAACYVTAIRTIQPEGPYLLSGWSFGGLMAFEMARQLYQQKQHIALLALFDTQSPPLLNKLIEQNDGLAHFLQQQIGQASKEPPLTPELLSTLEDEAQLHTVLQHIQQQQAFPEELLPWLQRFLQHTQADRQMIQSYQPDSYPGQITLFRADAHSEKSLPVSLTVMYHQLTYGWEAYSTSPLKVLPVPGTHDTIMEQPNIQILAAQLRQSIDDIAI